MRWRRTADDGDGGVINNAVGNGKVPSASPMDMFSLDSRVRGNDGAVVVGGGGGDGDGAVVVGTVAGGDGAVATVGGWRRCRCRCDKGRIYASPTQCNTVGTVGGDRAIAVGDGHVRPVVGGALRLDDETLAANGNHLKSSFPRKRESRTNNSAQPPEFNAAVTVTDKVPSATPTDMSSLDSRVRGNDGAVVAAGVATDNNRAVVTVATDGDGISNSALPPSAPLTP